MLWLNAPCTHQDGLHAEFHLMRGACQIPYELYFPVAGL